MPPEKWSGYKRFCPLARSLDLVGERWTLVIVHELVSSDKRYTELRRRLPGIGSSVLADRLRKLESAGLVERRPGEVGGGVLYALTDAGRGLEPALRELRRWGVGHLVDCDRGDDSSLSREFDMSFVEGVDELPREEYEWRIGDALTALSIDRGKLSQSCEVAADPAVAVEAPPQFMERWAAGEIDWETGRKNGTVTVRGTDDAWHRMLAATGYVTGYEPRTESDSTSS